MRSNSEPGGQKRRSVIEDVRRAQIIESAVETFAEVGYARTSLARIAERVGISKGVISYHFAGKDDLMEQVVTQVYSEIIAFVLPRLEGEPTVCGQLRARLRSVAEYVQNHPAQLVALAEIFNNARKADGTPLYDDDFNEPHYRSQENVFRAGQKTGELRPFDTRVMAVTVQAAIDAMVAYGASYPDHDLKAHADELADLFELGIRAQDPHSNENRDHSENRQVEER